MDKEWDEQQRKLQIPSYLQEGEEGAEQSPGVEAAAEAEEDPFSCPICKRSLTQPVRTKCNHYFCERCALKQFVKTQKCFKCGEGTSGIFVPAPKAFKERLVAHLAAPSKDLATVTATAAATSKATPFSAPSTT